MILYPAVDILGGQAVRLRQGRFEDSTVYETDPLEAARTWVAAGARALHLVDLDGARAGHPCHLVQLERISGQLGVPVQYGGGLRSLGAVRDALQAGARRVVLGTAAQRDLELVAELLRAFPGRIVVSVDARDGYVATAGWTETSAAPAPDVLRRLEDHGVSSFVYTQIEHDGMLSGPDLEGVRRAARAVRSELLYSGGVGELEHLRGLARLREGNLGGVIVGRALYEGRFTLAQGQAALDGGGDEGG